MRSHGDGKGETRPDLFALEAGVPAVEGSLRPKPRYADRISKRGIGVFVGLILLMAAIFFASLDAMDQPKQTHAEPAAAAKPQSAATKAGDTTVPSDLMAAPGADASSRRAGVGKQSLVGGASVHVPNEEQRGASGGVPSVAAGAAAEYSAHGAATRSGTGKPPLVPSPPDNGLEMAPNASQAALAVNPPPTPEQQAAQLARMERAKRMGLARSSGLLAKNYDGEDKKTPPAAVSATAAASLLANLQGQGGAATPAGLPAQAGQRSDSEQDEKLNFIKNTGKPDQIYLANAQMSAVSRNELQRGSYIPLRLESAINSGQPGMVRARVTEDVYDTVSGCRLLVPAMTVVQGVYDSKVSVGQTRNLVVWNFMRFEDGSHIDLGSMQGYDSTGAAGIEADVDNHYMRLFGLAFGMSMVTAGVQQSMPPTPTGTTAQTPEQALATALAQQYGQLGAQILGKQMQVQPTLKNYPGERFVIMLPQSVVLKKVWRARCGAAK